VAVRWKVLGGGVGRSFEVRGVRGVRVQSEVAGGVPGAALTAFDSAGVRARPVRCVAVLGTVWRPWLGRAVGMEGWPGVCSGA